MRVYGCTEMSVCGGWREKEKWRKAEQIRCVRKNEKERQKGVRIEGKENRRKERMVRK